MVPCVWVWMSVGDSVCALFFIRMYKYLVLCRPSAVWTSWRGHLVSRPSRHKVPCMSWYVSLHLPLSHPVRTAFPPVLLARSTHSRLSLQVQIDTAKFKDVANDLDFTKMLLQEKSVAVLPGDIFRAPNFVRIVFCAPPAMLTEACRRIADFCQEHAK
jgi:hypothetical protein